MSSWLTKTLKKVKEESSLNNLEEKLLKISGNIAEKNADKEKKKIVLNPENSISITFSSEEDEEFDDYPPIQQKKVLFI